MQQNWYVAKLAKQNWLTDLAACPMDWRWPRTALFGLIGTGRVFFQIFSFLNWADFLLVPVQVIIQIHHYFKCRKSFAIPNIIIVKGCRFWMIFHVDNCDENGRKLTTWCWSWLQSHPANRSPASGQTNRGPKNPRQVWPRPHRWPTHWWGILITIHQGSVF